MFKTDIVINSAKDDYLFDQNGERYFDLCMGYGSVSLGHGYEPIVRAQQEQLNTYASPSFIGSSIYDRSKKDIQDLVPDYGLHGFYPSGANAVEIAVKIAMHISGRKKVLSFRNSMHGKTVFANALGFDTSIVLPEHVCQLPFVDQLSEEKILEACASAMKNGDIAAIIIEPIQMSAGGTQASTSFYQAIQSLANEHQVLQIYDEILTGFFRSGSLFFSSEMGIYPDIILAGKAAGAGFPMSMVLLHSSLDLQNGLRTGGTFFNHPLICATVIATIQAFGDLNVALKTAAIERCVQDAIPAEYLKGKGALWNISFRSQKYCDAAIQRLAAERIVTSYYGMNIRLLPSFRVDLAHLKSACEIIKSCQ